MTNRRGGVVVAVLVACTMVVTGCSSSSGLKAVGGSATAPGAALPSAASTPGGGSAPALKVDNDKGRFVDMALDPSTGQGIDIDIYLGPEDVGLATPKTGDPISSLQPAPKKWVSNLAFGTATEYIPVPELSDAYITKAGSKTILNQLGADDEVYAADGMSSDDPNYAKEALQDTYVVRGGNSSTDKDLVVEQKHEADDPEQEDGGDLPIAGKAVFITSMDGTPSVDDSVNAGASERQLGLAAGSCLPEEHGEDLGRHDSYMNVGTSTPVEYVSDPGQVSLAAWATGDEAVCTGTPTATITTTAQAGSMYYVFGYGPALSPKLLVLSVPAPKSGKTASPTPDEDN